jgi:hypothetical protein
MGQEDADAFRLKAMSEAREADKNTGSMGLSQNELDALAVTAQQKCEVSSLEASEPFLLRVRRTRHFMGDEAADALVSEAMSKEHDGNDQDKDVDGQGSDDVSTASGSMSLPWSRFASGLSQEMLDTMSVCEEEAQAQPCSSGEEAQSSGPQNTNGKVKKGLQINTETDDICAVLEKVATPQRKRKTVQGLSPKSPTPTKSPAVNTTSV